MGIILRLAPYLLTELIVDAKLSFNDDTHERKELAIGEINDAMYDCFIHLLKLLAAPQDIPVLAPLTIKEIFYRLLMSPQGVRLKHIAASGTTAHRIGNTIHWIKDNFAQPFQVETLASEVGMSASSFHQHFRDITSMSPLQYQKRIRLSQAQRLLLTANKDIISAGYLSVSQFSREYKCFFGMTPSQ